MTDPRQSSLILFGAIALQSLCVTLFDITFPDFIYTVEGIMGICAIILDSPDWKDI
tara:strand:- start:1335 stop:1502 length:168 start_codon:yes stop_codon:yes gene_type:complete